MTFRGLTSTLSETLIAGLPIFGFLFIYLFSDIFGVLVLFLRLEPFYSVYVYHSGISLPVRLNADQMATYWLIAIGAPAVMSAAFFVVFRGLNRKLGLPAEPVGRRDVDPPFAFALLLFAALVYFGFWSLARGGGLDALWKWGNYADLVEARWQLFAKLSFFEFANLYQFIPVAGIGVLLLGLKLRGGARIVGVICAVISVGVGVLIFQKKIVITAILMIASALVIYSYFRDPKRASRLIGLAGAAGVVLAVVFFLSSVVPTLTSQVSAIGNSSNTAQDVDFIKDWRELSESDEPSKLDISPEEEETGASDEHDAAEAAPAGQSASGAAPDMASKPDTATKPATAAPKKSADAKKAEKKIDLKELAAREWERASRHPMINNPLVVSIVNLTMRTSVSAVYYVAVFPELHPYYPLDLGQDILGFGTMPNDNLIVWNYMYPEMPGLVAAPFNFVLYSQGGLFVVFAMSAFVGVVVGLVWVMILRPRTVSVTRAALGALIVVGTMHLALDALRNTAIVSYGFAWGLLPLALLAIAGHVASRFGSGRKAAIAQG